VSEAEVIRLFVAVPVPEAIKEQLQAVQRELQPMLRNASVRWTPAEQMHLTLRFFGNVETGRLEKLQTTLHNACEYASVLSLQARGLGLFPPKRAPRGIWVGVQDRQNQLGPLQKQIETTTADFGEKPEDREFSAHLTLGRIKEIRRAEERDLREFIMNQANRSRGEWEVHEIELVQSQLGSSGARHSVLRDMLYIECSIAYEIAHTPSSVIGMN
jgi:2'-5' RNA ligase